MSDLENKKRDVMAARSQMMGRVEEIKRRASPAALKDAAGDKLADVKDRSLAKARSRPFALAGAGLAAILFLFRKQITRAISARRDKGDDHG